MHRFLEDILSQRRARIQELKGALGQEAHSPGPDVAPPEDPAPAIRRGPGLIVAEIKKASPSRGAIALDVDIASRAQAYERGGAGAVSVLCEPDFFLGSRQDVRTAAVAVLIPVLCKDFILDPLQLRLARADGASWALLIARILGPDLPFMVREALRRGLEPLVEVHSEEEMGDAVLAGARLIGVNARDLDTFEVDLALVRASRLAVPAELRVHRRERHQGAGRPRLPQGCGGTRVPHRGGSHARGRSHPPPAGVQAGARPSRGGRIEMSHPVAASSLSAAAPWIKVCGIRSWTEVEGCAKAGATHVGINTWPRSPRAVANGLALELIRASLLNGLSPVVLHVPGSTLPAARAASSGARLLQTACAPSGAERGFLDRMGMALIEARPARRSSVPAMNWGEVLLLDASRPGAPGGTGAPFDWDLCSHAVRPFVLAGGLGPDNVAEAVRRTRPAGVDAASRLESHPGQKDLGRVREFCAAARAALKELHHVL